MATMTECSIVTNSGHALLGKVLAGKAMLHITRVSVGDGVAPVNQEELTELMNQITNGDIAVIDNPGTGEARISIQVSSMGLSVGFFVKEIGIFATDPDVGEILYAYVGIPDKPQWIRPDGESINSFSIFDIVIAISRATSFTAQICPTALVTIQRFTQALLNKADLDVRGKLASSQIPDIDCGTFDDDVTVETHDGSPYVHAVMLVDGNGDSATDTSETLEEHMKNPLAHQNLNIDGNGS